MRLLLIGLLLGGFIVAVIFICRILINSFVVLREREAKTNKKSNERMNENE